MHGLVAQGFAFRDERSPGLTVLYIGFAPERWARVGLDVGHFHWRETTEVEVISTTEDFAYPLTDLTSSVPILGRRISRVSLSTISDESSRLDFAFDDGSVLSMVDENDESHLFFNGVAV